MPADDSFRPQAQGEPLWPGPGSADPWTPGPMGRRGSAGPDRWAEGAIRHFGGRGGTATTPGTAARRAPLGTLSGLWWGGPFRQGGSGMPRRSPGCGFRRSSRLRWRRKADPPKGVGCSSGGPAMAGGGGHAGPGDFIAMAGILGINSGELPESAGPASLGRILPPPSQPRLQLRGWIGPVFPTTDAVAGPR